MAFERTLFEKLDRPDAAGKRTLHVDPQQEVDSVLRHLHKMLNVRQGNVRILPAYGMPDFNELAAQFPDAIVELQRAIQFSITHYEPRLKQVRVRHIPDEEDRFDLRFEITAYLITGEANPPVWFESTLDATGRVSIRG